MIFNLNDSDTVVAENNATVANIFVYFLQPLTGDT